MKIKFTLNNTEKKFGGPLLSLSGIVFWGAWGLLFWSIFTSNLVNWFLIHEKTFHCSGLSFLAATRDWAFILFLFIFPIGNMLHLTPYRLSVWWLMLLIASFFLGASDTFGFQSPYIDDIYSEKPFLKLPSVWGFWFVMLALTAGIGQTLFYYYNEFHKKHKKSLCSWGLALALTACGIMLFLLYCKFLTDF